MSTLGIYCRVSTQQQAERGSSIVTQQNHGIKKAKELGYNHKLYIETGESASKENWDNRPVLQELLADCATGVIEAIFIVDENRLSRNMQTKLLITSILREHKILLYSDSGSVDFNNEDSSFFSDLKTLLAQFETKKMSAQIRRVLKNNVSTGGVGTGKSIPYGFRNNDRMLAVNEETKPILQRLFKMSIEGYGTKHIATILNNEGVPSPNGKKWRDGTIYGILCNPAYYGKRLWQGEFYDCPSLITKETFDKAKSALKKRGKVLKNEKKYIYLLNDICTCGVCNGHMRGRQNKADGSNVYKCTSSRNTGETCTNKSINRPMFEGLVSKLVNVKIDGKNLISEVIASQINDTPQEQLREQMTKELETYKKRKNELSELYISGALDKEQVKKMGITLSQKIENLQAHLKSMNFKPNEPATVSELNNFNRFGLKRQHQLLKQLFSKVKITYIDEGKYWKLTFYSGVSGLVIMNVQINYKGKYIGFVNIEGAVDGTPLIQGTIEDNPFNRMSKNGKNGKKYLTPGKG